RGSRLTDGGDPARPAGRGMLVDRFRALAIRVVGWPSVATTRNVVDRFNRVDGGLLAAGVAYNAVLALIPLGLLASGLAGFLLRAPRSHVHGLQAGVSVAPT